MKEFCADCGAVHTDGRTCNSIFHEFLALEFMDPAYGRVHFLTVVCYMIQHNGYSDEALVWVELKLRAYLLNNLTGPEIRKRAAKDIDPGTRKKAIKREKDALRLPKVSWSMTIADVARNMYDAESYCNLITKWANRTISEMALLIQGKKDDESRGI